MREELAARFGLPAIPALSGVFTLRREAGGIVTGQLVMHAIVTQICVLSLEPFDARIEDKTELRFVPARGDDEPDALAFDPEMLDGPDEIPFHEDRIDLSAALAEQLALCLDPYPRKPGATLPAAASDGDANPFAALAARLPKN